MNADIVLLSGGICSAALRTGAVVRVAALSPSVFRRRSGTGVT